MKIRVLLADDHRMLREGLRRSLTEEGFDIVGEAENGEQAVALAGELAPDVVLMDVSMPEMDGVRATQIIRRKPDAPRVVMLTMHADAAVLDKAIRAGASGYLVKDCSSDEVVEAIQLAMADTALSSELAATMLDEARRLDPPESSADDRVITEREEEVLQLIADGRSTPEVAEHLFISDSTVKNHLYSIYDKLDARDRTQAVLRAVRMGIIDLV